LHLEIAFIFNRSLAEAETESGEEFISARVRTFLRFLFSISMPVHKRPEHFVELKIVNLHEVTQKARISAEAAFA
jgi:hypothetical protein